MDKEETRQRFNRHPRLKKWIDWMIMDPLLTRPRWYIRMLAPIYQYRARGSKIYSSVRMDTPDRKSVV